MLSAHEAAAAGLVNRVVPVEELDSVVSDWADRLVGGPPLALSMSKHLLNRSLEMSMEQAVEAEAQAQCVNLSSRDTAESIAAFIEKRTPRYEGR
jgi:2-(1,2-epoxy-1,2-dihydrophenyl)acetyl-CoA isomerase